MNTLISRGTRLAGFLVALGLTAIVNGAVLWKFDAVASKHAVNARGASAPMLVTLERVTIVAPRS